MYAPSANWFDKTRFQTSPYFKFSYLGNRSVLLGRAARSCSGWSYYRHQLFLQEEQNSADADFSPFYADTGCARERREAHGYKCPWEGGTRTIHAYVCVFKIAHLTVRLHSHMMHLSIAYGCIDVRSHCVYICTRTHVPTQSGWCACVCLYV